MAFANQLIVDPELAEACNVTVPFPHREAGVVAVIAVLLVIVAATGTLAEVHVPLVTDT